MSGAAMTTSGITPTSTPVTGAPASTPVGFFRAAGLLARLRLRRIANGFRTLSRYRMKSPDRKIASRASPFRTVFSVLILIFMFGSFVQMMYGSIQSIERGPVAAQAGTAADTGSGGRDAAPRAGPQHAQPAPGSVMEARVLKGLTVEATLILLAVLLTAVASAELTKPEWDLEWLVTLPLPLSTLIGSMLIERTVANPFGVIFLGAFLLALALETGWGFAAPLAASGLAVVLLFLMAIVQILADTGLRLALPPSRLRNMQALVGLVAAMPMLFVFWLATPGNLGMLDWIPVSYGWAQWLPGGLMVQALASSDAWQFVRSSGLLVAEVAAAVAIGSTLTWLQLRNGVVAAGAREGVARRPRAARPEVPRASTAVPPGRWSMLPAVQRRDLLLLGRDRALLVQAFVMPVVVVGMQVMIGPGNQYIRGFEPVPAVAAVAFYMAAFALMNPSFRALASEGQALWLLYALPRPLDDVVLQKAKLWGTVALVYPVAIFAVVVAMGHPIPAEFVMSGFVVLAGVAIFALIGVSLGVFAFDPLAQEEQRKVRVTHVYLYMLLASFYAYALFVPDIWQRLALMILMALMAMALWQKARDHFEYLLDPAAAPPSRVSLSDGLMAALTFFVLQGVAVIFQTQALELALGGRTIWIAFFLAGAITYGVVRFVYWRAGTQGVPVLVGRAPGALRQGVGWGLAGGVAASVGGIVYLVVTSALGLFPSPRANPIADPNLPYWIATLAIVAAPVFEEFIFRGLIFNGLRRLVSLPAAALASAAIFGLVHPAAAVIPVAGMGLVAALAYARTGALMAPILVHAVYNAAIIGFQWGVMQGLR
jgi:membrane protease YdiL (CAAX protease family)